MTTSSPASLLAEVSGGSTSARAPAPSRCARGTRERHAAAGRELARVCRAGGRLGVVAWRADPESEGMHAPFWPAREPGAGDRRDWGREEYVADLLGQEFELEFGEGELRLTAESGAEMWHLFTS